MAVSIAEISLRMWFVQKLIFLQRQSTMEGARLPRIGRAAMCRVHLLDFHHVCTHIPLCNEILIELRTALQYRRPRRHPEPIHQPARCDHRRILLDAAGARRHRLHHLLAAPDDRSPADVVVSELAKLGLVSFYCTRHDRRRL